MSTVLTNTGKAKMIGGIYGDSITPPTYVAWGTGSTTPTAADTGLTTPSAEARVSGTKSKQTTSVSNDTYQVTATITSASSQTIAEAGLFDASTSGSLYVHGTFTGIALGIGDAIDFTVTIQQT